MLALLQMSKWLTLRKRKGKIGSACFLGSILTGKESEYKWAGNSSFILWWATSQKKSRFKTLLHSRFNTLVSHAKQLGNSCLDFILYYSFGNKTVQTCITMIPNWSILWQESKHPSLFYPRAVCWSHLISIDTLLYESTSVDSSLYFSYPSVNHEEKNQGWVLLTFAMGPRMHAQKGFGDVGVDGQSLSPVLRLVL